MELWLALIIVTCVAVIICLSIWIANLRKSIERVSDSIQKINEDTNVLIRISSTDKKMCELAALLNSQLKLLRREKNRYEQGSRELREEITNIAHDLRTPITAIRGYLEIMDKSSLTEENARYIQMIENRTKALCALTDELFSFTLAVSAPQAQMTKTSLNRLIEDAFASFYKEFQEKAITPEIIMPANEVIKTLDVKSTSRILSNLISNAIKYSDGEFVFEMKENGEMTFANPSSTLDEVSVGKMFNRYFTVQNSSSSTGIGLCIAKELVVSQGGEISASYTNGTLIIKLHFN